MPPYLLVISAAEAWALTTTMSTPLFTLKSSDISFMTSSGLIKVYSSANCEEIEVIWSDPITPIIPTFKPLSKVLIVYFSPNSSAWSNTFLFSISKW